MARKVGRNYCFDLKKSIYCSYAGHSSFYLAVLPNPRTDVWFKASPLGVHYIESATKVLMSSLDLDSEKFVSNTSLRRTAMNRLIGAGVPTEVIRKKTGRVSEAADASYVSSEQY